MIVFVYSILFLFGLSGDDLQNQVSDYLLTRFKDYESVEFEILKQPAGYSSVEIMTGKNIKTSGNLAYIPVKLIKNNREAQSYITVRLKLLKNILVSVRDIKRKEKFNRSDFEFSTENIAGIESKLVTDVNGLTSFRSKKNLKKGSILTETDIEELPVINVGDKVKANIVEGNVIIQTDAVSKQEGAIGDIITITTAENKKFKAKIVNSNNVIIVE